MKLIQVEEEIPSALLRNIGPLKCYERERGHQECAKKRGRTFADLSLSEIHQEDLASIHDAPQVKGTLLPPQYLRQKWISQERSYLVVKRCSHNRPKGGAVVLVLVVPERPNFLVGDLPDDTLSPFPISQEAWYVAETCISRFQEGEDYVPQEVLKTRPPVIRPELLEDFDHTSRGKSPLLGLYACKGVEEP